MEFAGVLSEGGEAYIDHIAPFCAVQGIPLFCFDPSLADLVKRFYPEVSLWTTRGDLPQAIVTCEPFALTSMRFAMQGKRHFWLPHGNSDKCLFAFEALCKEDTALVYGPQMRARIAEKRPEVEMVEVGNFRLAYFLQHRTWYEKMRDAHLPSLPSPLYLFAPTWEDSEGNGTFFSHIEMLANSFPFSLWIQVHPNTYERHAPLLERWKGKVSANIVFLPPFPPIYPLLARVDGYIGDMSSIGYDFLYFQKPMFFTKTYEVPLHRCGKLVSSKDWTWDSSITLLQRELYDYAFAKSCAVSR